ncbi:hypothetical protein ACA910_007795 [Epithemia clementina (nom. ined.)]
MTGVHQADTRFYFSACEVDMSGIEESTDNTPAIVRTADQDANVVPPPAQYKRGEDDSISRFRVETASVKAAKAGLRAKQKVEKAKPASRAQQLKAAR